MIKEIVTAKELGEAIEYKKHGSLFLWALTESLCSIETSETSVKVSFLTFGDLYWQPSEGWTLHGIDFEGEPPQVTRSLRSVPELEAMVFSHMPGMEDYVFRYYLRLLNELIDKRLNKCRDGTTSFSIFDLGILVIDDGHMSFTPYSTSAADNPSQYARAIKLDARDGFTIAKGRFFSDLSADTCSLLLKKVSSRIRKKQGGVVGLDTRPFCLPPNVNFLDEEALSVLAGHRGCLDMSSIHKLDTAGARSLSAYEGCSYVEVRSNPFMRRCGYSLGGLSEISEEVAAELSRFDVKKPAWVTELWMSSTGEYDRAEIVHDFSGLKIVSPEALAQLAKLSGHLDLSGLREFYKEHAEALHDHVGGVLLDGLTSMTPDVAEELAKIKPGHYYDGFRRTPLISLGGLVNADSEVCSALLGYKGGLNLGSFDKLTADFAEHVKDHKFRLICNFVLYEAEAEKILTRRWDINPNGSEHLDYVAYKNSLISLPDSIAESLSRHNGKIGLGRLTKLSDAAAESLSKHEGELHLNGLTELSDAAAESLSKHEGELYLDGLTALSAAAAESLSQIGGRLSLDGLMELSDAAAESLSKHEGILSFGGLTELSDAAAESLSKYQGILGLDSLTELSAAAAESLSKYEGVVSLRGLAVGETDCCFNEEPYSLSEPAAESLSKHEGLLSLGGLLSLHSNALANALVTAVAERRLESDEDVLDLVTVFSLSDDAAEVLARHDGLILLTGLWELSSKSARILLEGTAEVDTFCSLKEIAKG